jgi:FkbM family methyltransferase
VFGIAQRALLFLYGLFYRPLHTRVGRGLFLFSYAAYKRFEARELVALAPIVPPGSTVIDVGANIGYCTRHFARWVGPRGRVIAIEPETENVGELRSGVRRTGFDHVECVHAAAGAHTGLGRLVVNRMHPGDHRLGTEGIEVAIVTVDSVMADRGWPRVSLIKIDVQGSELAVIAGAIETLRRWRPALFVEMDDEALLRQGASSHELVGRLETLGYAPHAIDRRGTPRRLDPAAVIQRSLAGRYLDVLWLPSDSARQPVSCDHPSSG